MDAQAGEGRKRTKPSFAGRQHLNISTRQDIVSSLRCIAAICAFNSCRSSDFSSFFGGSTGAEELVPADGDGD